MDENTVVPTICKLMTKLGSALVFGFVIFRCRIINDREGFAFLAGRIMLPLLAFKTVATASLGELQYVAILGCLWGKLVVFLVVITACFVVLRAHPMHHRILTAGLFGFHVTASNDFVIGLPIVAVFYPDSGLAQLTALVLAQYLVFQSVALVMVEVALAKRQRLQCQGPNPEECNRGLNRRMCARLAVNILWNPLICSVVLALIWKAVLAIAAPKVEAQNAIPSPLSDVIDIFTEGYAFIALFLTGANLTNAFERLGNCGSACDSLYYVGVPILLCLLKNIACPFVGLSFIQLLQPQSTGQEDWHMFTFLYGCIPTSNAPLFVALAAGAHCEVVAAAIFIGLVIAVPMLIVFATVFGVKTMVCMKHDIYQLQIWVSCTSTVASLIVLILLACLAWSKPAWRRAPFTMLPCYALSCLFYGMSLIGNAIACRHRFLEWWFTYCQMLCRTWAFLLLLNLSSRFSKLRAVRASMVAAWIVALPLSFIVPPSTLNEVCDLQFSSENMLVHSIFVTAAFLAMILLIFAAFVRRPGASRPKQDEGVESWAPAAALESGAPTGVQVTPQPRLHAIPLLDSPDGLDVGKKTNNNPPEAQGGNRLRAANGEVADTGEVAPPSIANQDSRQSIGTMDQVLAFEAAENLAIFSWQCTNQFTSSNSSSEDTDNPAMHQVCVDRFVLCALAIALKATLLFLLQMCNSWGIFLHAGAAPAYLQGMLVENFFEHSQGLFLLFFLVCFFDTPVADFVRRIRSFFKARRAKRRAARSG